MMIDIAYFYRRIYRLYSRYYKGTITHFIGTIIVVRSIDIRFNSQTIFLRKVHIIISMVMYLILIYYYNTPIW